MDEKAFERLAEKAEAKYAELYERLANRTERDS
jgi:hypothetical protein